MNNASGDFFFGLFIMLSESSEPPPTVLQDRREADLLRAVCGSSKDSDCQLHVHYLLTMLALFRAVKDSVWGQIRLKANHLTEKGVANVKKSGKPLAA
jgi:hypothetical protein